MRTRILIPFLAAAMLAPAVTGPAAAGDAFHDRGIRGHATHQGHHYVKPAPPRFGWFPRRPPAPHFAHVGRPHASRGWYVPPRPPVFSPPPWRRHHGPPVMHRPLPHGAFPRPRVVIVSPWRW